MLRLLNAVFFFFNDTATTEIYTLSLHDALPISVLTAAGKLPASPRPRKKRAMPNPIAERARAWAMPARLRSEEHTSELQSQSNLVCRLLLEKKKNNEYLI